MYVQLGEDETLPGVPAGCQLPYTSQGTAAYSRAFLERMNLAPGLRAAYVPSAATKKEMDWWRSVGLDPFQATSVAIARSKFACAGLNTPDQFAHAMQNKATLEQLARENMDLIAANKDLARYFQTAFKNARFLDSELATVVDQLQKTKANQAGAAAPAAMPAAPDLERPVVLVPNLVKPVAISAPVPVAALVNEPATVKITSSATVPNVAVLLAPASPPATMPSAPVSGSSSWLLIAGGLFLIYSLGKAK